MNDNESLRARLAEVGGAAQCPMRSPSPGNGPALAVLALLFTLCLWSL